MSKFQKLDDKQILTKLAKDFHDLIGNKEGLRASVESFLNNIIDELTLGIIFDLHRKYKTNSYEVEEEEEDGVDEEPSEWDMFGQNENKKNPEGLQCVCQVCHRSVTARGFGRHLEKCMGLGRVKVTRNATRPATNTYSKDNCSDTGLSDDEDDMDWKSGTKRGKKNKRNGAKKTKGGTPKKSGDSKTTETSNVEIEVEEDDSNLRDLLYDSSTTSPSESVSGRQSSSSKKKVKAKNKKNKGDRASPSFTISAE